MKTITKPYWLLWLFLCATTTVSAQDLFSTADSLANLGDYRRAGLVYEYIFWDSDDLTTQYRAKLGRAQTFKSRGEYAEALAQLEPINLIAAPEIIRQRVVYEQVLLNYLLGEYQMAITKGMFGESVFRGEEQSELEAPYWSCMALSAYRSGQLERGYSYSKKLGQIIDPHGTLGYQATLDSLLAREKPKQLHINRARIMSLFIPGSGLFYAGNKKDGLVNLGLNTVGFGGAVLAAVAGYYVAGWLIAATVVQRLYMQGSESAAELADTKNRLNETQFIQPVLEFLITFYPTT